MTGIMTRFAVILLILCAALVAGMTLAGKALPSRGQLLYLNTVGIIRDEIRSVDLATNIDIAVVEGIPRDRGIWFSPDRRLILFSRSDGHFYLVNNDDSNIRQLPTSYSNMNGASHWLDDNQHFVFSENRSNLITLRKVDMLDFTEEQINIELPALCTDYWFSPNGRYIAYRSADIHGGCVGFSIINLEGSERHNYFENRNFSYLVWSHNSQQAVIGGGNSIYWIPDTHRDQVIQVDGEGIVYLVPFSWSPDNTHILVAASDGLYTLQFMPSIYFSRVFADYSSYDFDSSPIWSPDSSQIAFASDHEGVSEVYIINADGTNMRRITYNQRFESAIWWLP